jgi:hypothetical protein
MVGEGEEEGLFLNRGDVYSETPAIDPIGSLERIGETASTSLPQLRTIMFFSCLMSAQNSELASTSLSLQVFGLYRRWLCSPHIIRPIVWHSDYHGSKEAGAQGSTEKRDFDESFLPW